MTLTDRLAAARSHWMSRYVDALAEYRRKYIPGGPEVLLQLGDNGAREAFRLYRVDLASGATAPPNLTEVNLASIPQFPPERSSFGSGLEVVVEPFHWNGVEFLVEGIGLEEAVLANWCKEWIDVDETHEPDIHGLIGAIHSMTAPEHRDNGVFFSVDFGSAPVEAVTSLLHLLSSIGAQKVRIGSGWAVNGRGDG